MAISPDIIGTELPSFSCDVERGRVRFFAEVIGETDPVFSDVEAARAAGHADLPAPPTFLFGYLLDRPDAGQWLDDLGIDLGNLLHAEQSFTYHRTAHAGETLSFRPRIVDTFEKKGGALQFVVRETEVVAADGSPVATLRETMAVVRPEGAAA